VAQHAHAADRFAHEILAILERGTMRSRRLMRNSVGGGGGRRMTLIATHLSRNGIVLASDSNLTGPTGFAGEAPKTFALPHIRAGLSVSGSYSVNGVRMDSWMPNFIAASAQQGCCSLAALAESLRAALQAGMRPQEKAGGSLIHMAGYVTDSNTYHPEFHFVRNIYAIDPSGAYADFRDTFQASEDFWSRDCQHRESPTGFVDDNYQVYANGYPEGRIAYMAAQEQLNQLFGTLWSQPVWRFRPPRSLQEAICFVRLYMSFIHGLFEVSDYPDPYVGGGIQICGIPPP
jgi:hypothetical protein